MSRFWIDLVPPRHHDEHHRCLRWQRLETSILGWRCQQWQAFQTRLCLQSIQMPRPWASLSLTLWSWSYLDLPNVSTVLGWVQCGACRRWLRPWPVWLPKEEPCQRWKTNLKNVSTFSLMISSSRRAICKFLGYGMPWVIKAVSKRTIFDPSRSELFRIAPITSGEKLTNRFQFRSTISIVLVRKHSSRQCL